MKSFMPEKAFWKRAMLFSIPIALQHMSSAILGIIDVSIISGMGEVAVAAVSLATQLFYIVSLITFGITSGASVYLARAYGERNEHSLRQTFALMLTLSMVLNIIIAVFCLVVPKTAMRFFTDDALTVKGGALYLVIITPTFVLYSLSNSLVAFFRSVNRPQIPMVATIVSLSVKVVLNFILIYGFGFVPAFGIAGAAISTLISKIVEFGICTYFILKYEEKKYVFRLSDMKYVKPASMICFVGKTYPVILNESLWGMGTSAFNAIFGRMGTGVVSAVSVAYQLEKLGNAFFYGISIGACVTISQTIGEKKFSEAKQLAGKYALAGFYIGTGIMLMMLAIDIPYVKLFFDALETRTQTLIMWLIAVYALYMPVRSLASALIMGVLRAGGDSRKAMIYDVLPVYVWSLPLGYILGLKFNLSIVAVLFVMQFKRFIKCAFALRRMISGKWINEKDIQ